MTPLIHPTPRYGDRKRSSVQVLFAFLAPVLLLITSSSFILAQSADEEVRTYIEKVEKGQIDEARQALPDLVAKHQNTAGILYLQGRLASDGIEAVKFYQGVVDNFPKNDWADDALYRIYQYYYALGLYRTANLKMQELEKEYPNSPYVSGKSAAKIPKNDDQPIKLTTKESVPAETTETIRSTPSAEKIKPAVAPEPYTLQTGAFSTVANAEKQKNFFEDLGYAVEITNKIRAGRSLYLVWVGSFTSADAARQFGKDVKAKYKISSIIVERY